MKPMKEEVFHPLAIIRRLREEQSAATLNRLLRSRHVGDLRLIFSVTGYLCIAAFVIGIFFVALLGAEIGSVGALLGGLIALASGVVAWTYQSGNSRLGTVDLFACEITTLCRVCTIVDLTRRYVDAFNADLRACDDKSPNRADQIALTRDAFSHYDVSESYTPIFDKNAGDLRVLEVKVVTNVTAFYTYFKAMNDARRALTTVKPPLHDAAMNDAWHTAFASVIYMQFLAFESARKAVRDLVEFEPNQIENVTSILISEVCAYQFLLDYFGTVQGKEDFRYARLQMRRNGYRKVVEESYRRAKQEYHAATIDYNRSIGRAHHCKATSSEVESNVIADTRLHEEIVNNEDNLEQWGKASATATELKNRYEKLFGKDDIKWYQAELTDPA
jgi:hypothetical protein